MSSYLETYGASEELRARRIRLLKIGSILLVCAIVAGVAIYALLKNRGEEQQAKLFINLVSDHNYSAAYRLWGCTEANPCPNYPIGKFMDDWGPQSVHPDQSSAEIGLSQSCGSGVVIRLDYKGSPQSVPLWVERASRTISSAPWQECPGRHLHVGAWLRSIFKR
jgi:hypothetical protein